MMSTNCNVKPKQYVRMIILLENCKGSKLGITNELQCMHEHA